jgi:hypothetical protein
MALSNLKGIPKKPPYADADVERVKGLLNSGAVDVGEVSQYFKVPKNVVVGNLLGIPADAYSSGKATPQQAKAVERLIKKGVANTSEVAQYFSAPPAVVEQSLKEDFLYNEAQVKEAQQGLPVSAPTQKQIESIPVDGDYTEAETQLVQDALEAGTYTAAQIANNFQVQEQQVADELKRRQEVQQQGFTDIANPYPQGIPAAMAAFNNQAATPSATPLAGGAAAGGAAAGGAAGGVAGGGAGGTPVATGTGGTTTGTPAATPSGIQNTTDPNAVAAKDKLPLTAVANYATGSDIPIGLKGSEQALKGTTAASIDVLDAVNRAGRQDINPYAIAGQDALRTQRALAGLDGQAAFDAAYQESPQMKFLREQGERAALRNAAATGGLGGGNVLKELTRYNTGLASQDLQNQIANINQLSGRGFNAATQMAGLNLNTGLPAANAINTLGINLATGRTDAATKLADQYGDASNKLANILGSQGLNISNLVGNTASSINNARNNAAINEARAQENFGVNQSNIQSGIGNQLAGLPMAPIAVPNYQQGIENAFNSAALGAEVFGRNDGGAPVDTSKGIPNPNYQTPNATWGNYTMGNTNYQLNSPVRR